MQALNGPKGFLSSDRLKKFSNHRNDPNQPDALSNLSPYYHFGHLAAQRAALEASKLRSKAKVSHSHCWTCSDGPCHWLKRQICGQQRQLGTIAAARRGAV